MSVLRKFLKTKAPQIPQCSAVILAAGQSSRMGYDKILADLDGMPVIARTIKAFQDTTCISEIVVVTKMESVAAIAEICREHDFGKVTKVLCGGSTRAQSALAGVSEVNPAAKLIAIHDGARPLVTESVIVSAAECATSKLAAAPAIKATDTIKLVDDDGMVTETIDRSKVLLMQTPQVFDANIIKGALTRAVESGAEITDDCAAVEAIGVNVFTVPGDAENIKLTTPQDFFLAERIFEDRGELF